jgi:cupin superfamily acireductone dioxygenase involved in methionine salvage
MEENTEKTKLSYEELETIAAQTSEQLERAKGIINQMQQQIAQLQNQQGYARLEFLHKLIKLADKFPADVVDKAVKEYSDIMYPTEEPTKAE